MQTRLHLGASQQWHFPLRGVLVSVAVLLIAAFAFVVLLRRLGNQLREPEIGKIESHSLDNSSAGGKKPATVDSQGTDSRKAKTPLRPSAPEDQLAMAVRKDPRLLIRDPKPPARETKPRESATPRRSSGIDKPAVSYSQVRSVYLDPATVDVPQQLHAELSKQMAENGFAIEPSRDRADARLRIITLARSSWAFRLVNDSRRGIPLSTVHADVDKQEEVKRAARQVVEALLQITSHPSTPH
jgi:hypothetical protein